MTGWFLARVPKSSFARVRRVFVPLEPTHMEDGDEGEDQANEKENGRDGEEQKGESKRIKTTTT